MFENLESSKMKPYLDDTFDPKFKEHQNHLHWLPWVGKNYSKCPRGKKLLIVGESTYVPVNEEPEDGYDAETFTRMFILKEGMKQAPWYNGQPTNHLIRNTEKAIFWDDDEQTDQFKRKLWSSVAYFNFIQRLLDSNNSRPTEEDWKLGWTVFVNVLTILKPDLVLFCGVEASNQISSFMEAVNDSTYKAEDIKRHEMIGNTYPRTTVISSHDNCKIPVIFMKHPSKYFQYDSWAAFLFSQIEDYVKWMCKAE